MEAVPVTVITGFLGAGKTTLLERWLSDFARGEVAVIVNEVAAVGFDGERLRRHVEALIEIAGGCVCCTTSAELAAALATLAARRPRRIFVETSGAASPAGVVRAVFGCEAVTLDGIVTVVDGTQAPLGDAARADLSAEQVGYADVVVLSHAEHLTDAARAEMRQALRLRNPTAAYAEAAQGVVQGAHTLEALLALRQQGVFPVPPATVHERFDTLVLVHPGALDEERFGDWVERELGAFAGRLLRVKGVVAVAGVDERVHLQGVADRMDITLGEPWGSEARTSQLAIVGFALDERHLRQSFASCFA